MTTARELEVSFTDELGRCELCGRYVPEVELTETPDGVDCEECLAVDDE